MPGGDMLADLGTKSIGGQRLDHLKVLMNMKALKEDEDKEDADQENVKNKEDADQKNAEKKEDKMIEGKNKDQKQQMGSQMKAVKALGAIILAAQIGQVRAQGDDDHGGIDWLIALYTLLVVIVTLCVRWLCCLGNGIGEEALEGGDFSRMPSSEESWSVDDQGREILRPSRRIRGTPALVRACPYRTRTPTPQSSRDRSSSPPTSQSARGSDEPMSPRSLQRLAARVRDELLRVGVPFQEQAQPGLHNIQEEMEEESPVPLSGESSGVGTLTMSHEPTRSRSRSRSEEVGEIAPRPQADDPGGAGQEPFEAQIALREVQEIVQEEMLGGPMNGSRPGPPRPNIQPPPPAVFEPGRHHFFLSPTDERYHMSRQCRGLRKASRILECGRCTGCLPIEPRWEPGDRTLYSVGPGRPIHGNNTHRITEMREEELRAYIMRER